MRNTKTFALLTVTVLAVIITAAAFIVCLPETKVRAAETAVIADPDSDTIGYNGESYDIAAYTDGYESSGADIKEYLNTNGIRTFDITVTADDPIVNIIPKEEFTKAGSSFVIGEEWGYYIKTERDSYDTADALRSYVTLFDIEDSRNDLTGEYETAIDVLAQNLYVTSFADEATVYIPSPYNDDVTDDKHTAAIVRYSGLSDDDVVVSYCTECPRFYLRDVSFAASLHNENELNRYDEGYMASEDLGSFFTGITYGYSGKIWQKGTFDTGEDLVYPFTESSVDALIGCIQTTPVIGTVISVLQYVDSLFDIAADIYDKTSYDLDDTENPLEFTSFGTNRDDQLLHTGGYLVKTAGMALNSSPDGSQLWYGEDDTATVLYLIGHSALNGVPAWYTRIDREIGLKIVDIADGETAEGGISVKTDHLRDPVYDTLALGEARPAYVLSGGADFFTFTPEYSGRYELGFEGIKDFDESKASIVMRGSDSNVISPVSGTTYDLKADVTYKAVISHTESARFNVTLGMEEMPSALTIAPGDTVLARVGYVDGEVSGLSSGNDNITIEGVLRENGGALELLDTYNGVTEVVYAWDSEQYGDYYVLLKNGSSSSQTACLELSDIPEVYVGADGLAETDVYFDGEHYSYIRFTDLPAGNYVVTVEGITNSYIYAVNNNLDIVPTSSYGASTFTFNNNVQNNIIYLAVKTSLLGTYDCVINLQDEAYQWKINGNLTYDTIYYAEQGEIIELSFVVNGKEQNNCSLKISNDEDYAYSVNDNSIGIQGDCYAGGKGFTIAASPVIGIEYSHHLTVIPTIKYPFEGVTIDSINNRNNVTIEWENVNNLESFVVAVQDSAFSTTIDVSEYPDNKFILYEHELPDNMPIMTLIVTSVCYDWAKVGLTSVSVDDLTLTFDYYFGGGTGTSYDMYKISEERHFNNMGKMTDANIYYELTQDIAVYANCSNIDLRGIFEGNDHEITWTYFFTASDTYEDNDPLGNGGYAVPNYQGLFQTNYGIIKNLDVEVDFDGDPQFNFSIRQYMGGIAGRNIGTIQYCNISGDINSNMNKHVLGGIAGYNSGVVANCYNTSCEIRGAYVIGGLVGYNVGSGTVSSGRVNRVDFTLHNAPYWNSADADINAIGGVVGINDGKVISCHVGSDSYGGYLRFEDMEAQTRPYAGEMIGAQKRTGASMTNCIDSGMAVLDSDLTLAQRKNINKVGGGLIGNTY